jgi:MinD superfamily P-loop ATPase
LIIVDGPPGIGCPVIAAVTGVDAALVVTEPTMSGIHDLRRALRLLEHFGVLPFVCVNMYDINQENLHKIRSFCRRNGVRFVGQIPFNPIVTKSMINRKPIVEYAPESDVAKQIVKIWREVSSALAMSTVLEIT